MNYLYAAPRMDTLGTKTRIPPSLFLCPNHWHILCHTSYSHLLILIVFAFFPVQAGAGCAMGPIPWERAGWTRKMDEEWIRSGKGQSKEQGLEKGRKTPEKNTVDQELETSFRSLERLKGKCDNHRREECGELLQDPGYKNLISRIQREGQKGRRAEGKGWQSSSTPFFQERSN